VRRRPELAARDGWVVYRVGMDMAPRRPLVRVRHLSWGDAFHAITARHLAAQMQMMERAASRGTAVGTTSRREIPTEAVPTVLALLREALPKVLRGLSPEDWDGVPASEYGPTVALLEDLGVDPVVFLGAGDEE
jgi:hypothetical protein